MITVENGFEAGKKWQDSYLDQCGNAGRLGLGGDSGDAEKLMELRCILKLE